MASLAVAGSAHGQAGVSASIDALTGCYSFEGADEKSGNTIAERFRLTAETSYPEGLPGPWQVVSAVPRERLRAPSAAWSVGANTMIRVVFIFESARVLLQFSQITDDLSAPIEGMLAGPGPEPGVAQVARGFVVRIPC